MLHTNLPQLHTLAQALLTHETLDSKEIHAVINGQPISKPLDATAASPTPGATVVPITSAAAKS